MKNYLDYKNKVIVVTGAASGMGKATSEILVDLGAEVYAIYYAEADLPQAKKDLRCNLGNKVEIDATFEELPQEIDSFFGIAGVSGQHHDYNSTLAINFVANKYIVEEYLTKRMKDKGSIVFVSSLASLWWENHVDETKPFIDAIGWEGTMRAIEDLDLNDKPGTDAYFLSKRLVNHLVGASVPEFAVKKVRLNAIMPGAAKTGLTKDFADMMGGEENLVLGFSDRPATAEEMAGPLVYLNSSMAAFINGVCLPIDAGETSKQMINAAPREYDFDIFGNK